MPLLQFLINLPFLFAGVLVKWLFFCKKGFGRRYLEGIAEGIGQCRTCRKVRFKVGNLRNYVKIDGNSLQIYFAYYRTDNGKKRLSIKE